jgi:hypothetical protein
MAQVLVLTRQDGTTEKAHIGSPYLAVMFEKAHGREVKTSLDTSWLAFYDRHDRAPEDEAELLAWLKPFIDTDVVDLPVAEDPTVTENGSAPLSSLPS